MSTNYFTQVFLLSITDYELGVVSVKEKLRWDNTAGWDMSEESQKARRPNGWRRPVGGTIWMYSELKKHREKQKGSLEAEDRNELRRGIEAWVRRWKVKEHKKKEEEYRACTQFYDNMVVIFFNLRFFSSLFILW